jgi:hypothetical protein
MENSLPRKKVLSYRTVALGLGEFNEILLTLELFLIILTWTGHIQITDNHVRVYLCGRPL